ncbi:hypothetical protein XELAEV_18021454mg [Xenopus laevis]|uniref:Uncharacterized protein n=1 Tax=Xenopus laevis TaxID=8355 RepID=A0A974DBK5_XENLA|nr:hypothetical protein XELAEV_18021454mg [Xenopus laevis]
MHAHKQVHAWTSARTEDTYVRMRGGAQVATVQELLPQFEGPNIIAVYKSNMFFLFLMCTGSPVSSTTESSGGPKRALVQISAGRGLPCFMELGYRGCHPQEQYYLQFRDNV